MTDAARMRSLYKAALRVMEPDARARELTDDEIDLLLAAATAPLRTRLEKLEKLDSEAAKYVESLICLKSNRFTGMPPYVGWKGLGQALAEDYAELAELRDLKVEHEQTFDLRWKADQRAIERWQKATGKTATLPDHADLCVWLMEQSAPTEWQPIETAPKAPVYRDWRCGPLMYLRPSWGGWTVGYWSEIYNCFRYIGEDDPNDEQPTHWGGLVAVPSLYPGDVEPERI